ncbi:hypothetical protein [Streptomyces sp. SID13588]|uniref:hypothetical protein n=1 Tax=Streptomyces sp. SID13588 TaxID=2706051 RepID=UPI001EF2A63B|nr:hypothetical protein [Streptomyces sp. SID13588]
MIGSAGFDAKVDYLVAELGFDAAFDYHDGPAVDHLRRLAPEVITMFFDNVGGEQFDTRGPGAWLDQGRFVFPHTIVDGGLRQAPQALCSLLDGGYRGNVSVHVSGV